jgi:hypothetical protein
VRVSWSGWKGEKETTLLRSNNNPAWFDGKWIRFLFLCKFVGVEKVLIKNGSAPSLSCYFFFWPTTHPDQVSLGFSGNYSENGRFGVAVGGGSPSAPLPHHTSLASNSCMPFLSIRG